MFQKTCADAVDRVKEIQAQTRYVKAFTSLSSK